MPGGQGRCVSELRTLLQAMPTDFLALMKPTAWCHTGGDRAPGKAAPSAYAYGSKRVPKKVTDPHVDSVAIWSLLGGPHPQHCPVLPREETGVQKYTFNRD